MPTFYSVALKTFKSLYSNTQPRPDLSQVSVKTIYSQLVASSFKAPVVERRLTHIHFASTWRYMYMSPLSTGPRDVCWRICHNIIPLRGFLRKFQRVPCDHCPLCDTQVEYIFHLFYSCPIVEPLWNIVNYWLSKITGSNVVLSLEQAIYFNFAQWSMKYARIATVLSSELLYAILINRIEVVFDHKRQGTIEIERLFRHRVRWCIKTNFVRRHRQVFLDLCCNAKILAMLQSDLV